MELPKGFFYIRCKSQKYALDVEGGGMMNNVNIIIYPQKYQDSINQLWMHENGFLINKKSGLVLDIRGGNIRRDDEIIQYARKPGLAHNQRWAYDDGFVYSKSSPDLVLDIRNKDHIFLNTRSLTSITQQWIIEPFENEKSNAELALLRPSVLQRTSSFPRQNELYDCYRLVYFGSGQKATAEELAGAAAFKAMKDYIQSYKNTSITKEPIVYNEVTRQELTELVEKEVTQALALGKINQDMDELVKSATFVSVSYFNREYSI